MPELMLFRAYVHQECWEARLSRLVTIVTVGDDGRLRALRQTECDAPADKVRPGRIRSEDDVLGGGRGVRSFRHWGQCAHDDRPDRRDLSRPRWTRAWRQDQLDQGPSGSAPLSPHLRLWAR